MKWSWGYRWEQERSPDWQESGAITLTSGFHKGRDSPFDRWVQGERSLPRVMERRNVLMALDGFNTQEEPRPEGCNGSAQRAPLPRLRCSTPHILRVRDNPIPAKNHAVQQFSKYDGFLVHTRLYIGIVGSCRQMRRSRSNQSLSSTATRVALLAFCLIRISDRFA